jgi:hypothetical protein
LIIISTEDFSEKKEPIEIKHLMKIKKKEKQKNQIKMGSK